MSSLLIRVSTSHDGMSKGILIDALADFFLEQGLSTTTRSDPIDRKKGDFFMEVIDNPDLIVAAIEKLKTQLEYNCQSKPNLA